MQFTNEKSEPDLHIYNKAKQLLESGQYLNLIKLLNQVLNSLNKDTYLNYLRALAYYKQAQITRSIQLLTNAFEDCKIIIEFEDKTSSDNMQAKQVIACTYHLRAKIYKHMNLLDASLLDLNHIIENNMYHKEEAYIERGIIYYKTQQYHAAISDFTCALTDINVEQDSYSPLYIKLLIFWGHTLLKQYFLDQALSYYKTAIDLSSDAVHLIATEKAFIFERIRSEENELKCITLLNKSLYDKNDYLHKILFCKRGELPCYKVSGEAKLCNKELKKLLKKHSVISLNNEGDYKVFNNQTKRFHFFSHEHDKNSYHLEMTSFNNNNFQQP